MEKLDLTKTDKVYFTAKKTPHVVNISKVQFLSIRGKGDPNGDDFKKHIETLYSTAYPIKFEFKAKKKDFVVSKLEGLWWYDEEKYRNKTIETATEIPRSEWEYRLLIRLPEFVGKNDLNLSNGVEYFEMNEGKCVQMMHVGPFSTEPESLRLIGDFCKQNGFEKNGLHHEIYLSDHRRTAPEKLKTILREPVR